MRWRQHELLRWICLPRRFRRWVLLSSDDGRGPKSLPRVGAAGGVRMPCAGAVVHLGTETMYVYMWTHLDLRGLRALGRDQRGR